jgi:exodeoxyribonuclease VII small subunit
VKDDVLKDSAMAAEHTDPVTPVSELGYEQCRDELIDVVQRLEQGGLDLDASLSLWERGEQLAKRCEEHLAGARRRVREALDAAPGDDAQA